MSLTEQVTLYAAVIIAMLTLLRLISGITGSRSVKLSILKTAVYSAIALVGAWVPKYLLTFVFFREFLNGYSDSARILSITWQGLWFIFVTYHFVLGVLLRLYVRATRFKDWGVLENLREIPWVKARRQAANKKKGNVKGYEIKPPKNASDDKTLEIFKNYLTNRISFRRPVLVSGESPWDLRVTIVQMLIDLVSTTEEEFNYVCCTVSPANIWFLIVRECTDEKVLAKLKDRLVFVDAYTETFGFGDEILSERIIALKSEEHLEIVSCSSAAGVHKGTTDAFKILKNNAVTAKRTRGACTVIYDSLSSLAITETEDEIAEFVIHLAAAELTYDMQTIFVEPEVDTRKSISVDAIRLSCGAAIILGQDR